MVGTAVVCLGIGLVVLSVILFISNFTYRNVAGKKIRQELDREYKR